MRRKGNQLIALGQYLQKSPLTEALLKLLITALTSCL